MATGEAFFEQYETRPFQGVVVAAVFAPNDPVFPAAKAKMLAQMVLLQIASGFLIFWVKGAAHHIRLWFWLFTPGPPFVPYPFEVGSDFLKQGVLLFDDG